MQKVTMLLFALLSSFSFNGLDAQEAFSSCTAAFLDKKMIVDEYSPTGKCVLSQKATGMLTVCTADLNENGGTAVEKIKFKVAIRNGNSKTLIMFSEKTYEEIHLSAVLKKCQKGDAIVLITLNDQYALPHNEILIQ